MQLYFLSRLYCLDTYALSACSSCAQVSLNETDLDYANDKASLVDTVGTLKSTATAESNGMTIEKYCKP
jgi:hypothetical protein